MLMLRCHRLQAVVSSFSVLRNHWPRKTSHLETLAHVSKEKFLSFNPMTLLPCLKQTSCPENRPNLKDISCANYWFSGALLVSRRAPGIHWIYPRGRRWPKDAGSSPTTMTWSLGLGVPRCRPFVRVWTKCTPAYIQNLPHLDQSVRKRAFPSITCRLAWNDWLNTFIRIPNVTFSWRLAIKSEEKNLGGNHREVEQVVIPNKKREIKEIQQW